MQFFIVQQMTFLTACEWLESQTHRRAFRLFSCGRLCYAQFVLLLGSYSLKTVWHLLNSKQSVYINSFCIQWLTFFNKLCNKPAKLSFKVTGYRRLLSKYRFFQRWSFLSLNIYLSNSYWIIKQIDSQYNMWYYIIYVDSNYYETYFSILSSHGLNCLFTNIRVILVAMI